MRKAPPAYDFVGSLIAFERNVTSGTADPDTERVASAIRLLRLGNHRSSVVAQAVGRTSRNGPEGPFVSGPRLDRGFVYWRASRYAEKGSHDDIVRRRVAGGPGATLERNGRAYADSPAGTLDSFAVYRRRLFYLYGAFSIGRVDPGPVFR